MPPPNFARKKRKSRSRGSSAKRASRHKSDLNTLKQDQRSSSVDVTSASSSSKPEVDVSACPGTSSEGQPVVELSTKESLISSLADSVATAAIETAESLFKGSPHKRAHRKAAKKGVTGPKSNSNCEELESGKMVGEEEKLDKLCQLLERLDATYGKNSCQSSPLHGIKKEPASENGLTSPSKVNVIVEKKVVNAVSQEVELTQDEKQALRKAKKESKKGNKSSAPIKACETTIDSVDLNSLSITNGEVPSQLQKVTDSKSEKSKADLRRERREKQEAQRAAKNASVPVKPEVKIETPSKEKIKVAKIVPAEKPIVVKKKAIKSSRHLPLLEHLSTSKADENLGTINGSAIHPAIRTAGLSMKDLLKDGCISRVLTTLSAIYNLIEDFQTPPSCDFSRALADQLATNISFLNACRPISEPINNAIRFVKKEINDLSCSTPERQARETLLTAINTYIDQNISLASETLTQNALEFIEHNDVILTFGFSTLVYETIKAAVKTKDNLSVVVVDNSGAASGIDMLQDFVKLGVKVYYRILSDLTRIIKKVTKVFVEAEAVVLNGAVIGRCGMAGVISLASSYSVPILVLSHTFKFCNIDLTDSLVVNELGDPSVIVNCPSSPYKNYLANWEASSHLNVVNLVYDVTPPRLINVLVTEDSNYPTTVVPVVIKRNYADILGHD